MRNTEEEEEFLSGQEREIDVKQNGKTGRRERSKAEEEEKA